MCMFHGGKRYMKLKIFRLFLSCSLVACAGVAFAAGTHTGGHGHGHSDGDAGIGEPGVKAMVDRTVHIDMNDQMRFVPAHITVSQGETIRFLVKNIDEIDHEFVLGTETELMKHNEMMEKFPEAKHEDPNQVRVAPGQVGEVVWRFANSGKVSFGCLIPGHYTAGMKGAVSVANNS